MTRRGTGRATHVVKEDAIGRDEEVLHLGQVEGDLQHGVAVRSLGRVHRAST
jgi:hypothetical protein